MIVVKLEMWPLGNESKAYTLGRTYIWNKGNGTTTKGNYGFAVMRKGCEQQLPDELNITRNGEVNNYPRLAYNVWRLIFRVLKNAFPEEK